MPLLSLVPGTQEVPGGCLLGKQMVHLGNSERKEPEARAGEGDLQGGWRRKVGWALERCVEAGALQSEDSEEPPRLGDRSVVAHYILGSKL